MSDGKSCSHLEMSSFPGFAMMRNVSFTSTGIYYSDPSWVKMREIECKPEYVCPHVFIRELIFDSLSADDFLWLLEGF